MKSAVLLAGLMLTWTSIALAGEVIVDMKAFGKSLGGWKGKHQKMIEYEMADNRYRSYRPDISPTPGGGLFISVRIDHVRGIFASNDHASLEMTVDAQGQVVSTKSSISIQGQRVTSDLIAGSLRGAGRASTISPAESVVALGTDLVANLTEKLSRETKVEPGRVSFPAVVIHNFNLLYQAIHVLPDPMPVPTPAAPAPTPTPEPSAVAQAQAPLPAPPSDSGEE